MDRGPYTIAELGTQIEPSDPFHIVDETTYGLFDQAHRVTQVISSSGGRLHLGDLVRRTRPGSQEDGLELVFAPNGSQPWDLIGPVVEWMRVHGVESGG